MAEEPGPETVAPSLLSSRLPLLLVLAYTVVVAIGYIGDPLALSPQLDSKENLTLAYQLSQGTLSTEPMYRAMLYPWLISKVPVPELWPQLAVVAGILLHILAAFQVRGLSGYIWESQGAKLLSFCLYALNPATIFYAMQVMDMTLAIVLFLGSLQLLLRDKQPSAARLIVAGSLAGLACLARPHFLPVSLLLLLVPIIRNWPVKLPKAASGLLVLAGLAGILCLQGAVNLNLSGEFRILPWQGSYNLWAANRPGANGLYYKQVVDVSGESFLNPARAESEFLYAQETQASPPYSIDDMNSHWKSKAIASFFSEPVRWIKLGLFKGYAVLNSFEQYNNMTFSFHKSRILPLKLNPLNWGILLIAGCVGLYALALRNPRDTLILLLVAGGYMVSLIIYYASARFRLPLVPLLAVLGGGVVAGYGQLLKDSRQKITSAAILVVATCVTYSSFGGIRNKTTYVQDHLLLANAYAGTGRDSEAATHAKTVLDEYSIRREAQRIYMISYFNMQLTQSEDVLGFGGWEEQKRYVPEDSSIDSLQKTILGVYLWMWGQKDQAVSIWQLQGQQEDEGSNLAKACLAAIGREVPQGLKNPALVEALSRVLSE
ncbi:MAG: hypothetical protein AB3N63_15395 [Puniceicoccaceae bacterium]